MVMTARIAMVFTLHGGRTWHDSAHIQWSRDSRKGDSRERVIHERVINVS